MSNQVLKLTCTIKESGTAGVFIGKINEIGGIFAQANSVDGVYNDLVRHTYIMLQNKREEAIALLQKQAQGRLDELFASHVPSFKLEIYNIPNLQAA